MRILPAEATALVDSPDCDVVLVDARRELASARSLCRVLRTTGIGIPLLAVLTEGGLAGLTAEWGVDDVLLDTAGPGRGRGPAAAGHDQGTGRRRRASTCRSPPASSSSTRRPTPRKFRGRPLDLTYKEFELLKYLAQHPGRVFTRAQLLQEVWGYDYFGGTRTVDVHVRRLRAKLGPEHEALIGTVRNVGYRFVPDRAEDPRLADDPRPSRLTPRRRNAARLPDGELGGDTRRARRRWRLRARHQACW